MSDENTKVKEDHIAVDNCDPNAKAMFKLSQLNLSGSDLPVLTLWTPNRVISLG